MGQFVEAYSARLDELAIVEMRASVNGGVGHRAVETYGCFQPWFQGWRVPEARLVGPT